MKKHEKARAWDVLIHKLKIHNTITLSLEADGYIAWGSIEDGQHSHCKPFLLGDSLQFKDCLNDVPEE